MRREKSTGWISRFLCNMQSGLQEWQPEIWARAMYRRDVYETFIEKLPATIMLTVSSVLLTMLIAIPFGILSAVKHNKWIDYLIRFSVS